MIYLLVLLGVIGCMALMDARWRLVLWDRPVAGAVVLAVGLAWFLGWDLWAIDAGIFVHRDSPLMTGVMLADQLPLEEAFFLLFLSYLAMILFTGAGRLLAGRAARRGASAASGAVRPPADGGEGER